MSNDVRKISDIMLNLEQQMLSLIKKVELNNFNNTLILAQLNKLLKTEKPVVTKQLENKEKLSKVEAKIITTTSIESNSLNESIQITKIPVIQRIVDDSGKDLFMAEVSIINKDTAELVGKFKTNAVGKWQAYLSSGNYLVKVSKIDSISRKLMEKEQSFEIVNDIKSLQLPNLIIEKI